jgi:hypothetical protein
MVFVSFGFRSEATQVKTTRQILLAAVLLPLLAACEDLTLEGGSTVAAAAIVDAQGNVLAAASPAGVTSGEVVVAAGSARTLRVELRDRAGRAVSPAAGATVDVTVTSVLIADWIPETTLTGQLVGRAAGVTTLRVDYRVAGRLEYGSPLMAVRVQ